MVPTDPSLAGVALEPYPDDGVAAATLGTALWALAAVACLLMRDQLAQQGNEWWIGTCSAGFVLGLALVAFTRRRAHAYRAHREALARGDAGPPGPMPR